MKKRIVVLMTVMVMMVMAAVPCLAYSAPTTVDDSTSVATTSQALAYYNEKYNVSMNYCVALTRATISDASGIRETYQSFIVSEKPIYFMVNTGYMMTDGKVGSTDYNQNVGYGILESAPSVWSGPVSYKVENVQASGYDIYNSIGNLVFQVPTLTLPELVAESVTTQTVMGQILGLIPLCLIFITGLVGFWKAWSFLLQTLHKA